MRIDSAAGRRAANRPFAESRRVAARRTRPGWIPAFLLTLLTLGGAGVADASVMAPFTAVRSIALNYSLSGASGVADGTKAAILIDGKTFVVDTRTGRSTLVRRGKNGGTFACVGSVEVLPDGRVASFDAGGIEVVTLAGLAVSARVRIDALSAITACASDLQGHVALVGRAPGEAARSVWTYDLNTGNAARLTPSGWPGGSGPTAVAFFPNGSRLLVTFNANNVAPSPVAYVLDPVGGTVHQIQGVPAGEASTFRMGPSVVGDDMVLISRVDSRYVYGEGSTFLWHDSDQTLVPLAVLSTVMTPDKFGGSAICSWTAPGAARVALPDASGDLSRGFNVSGCGSGFDVIPGASRYGVAWIDASSAFDLQTLTPLGSTGSRYSGVGWIYGGPGRLSWRAKRGIWELLPGSAPRLALPIAGKSFPAGLSSASGAALPGGAVVTPLDPYGLFVGRIDDRGFLPSPRPGTERGIGPAGCSTKCGFEYRFTPTTPVSRVFCVDGRSPIHLVRVTPGRSTRVVLRGSSFCTFQAIGGGRTSMPVGFRKVFSRPSGGAG